MPHGEYGYAECTIDFRLGLAGNETFQLRASQYTRGADFAAQFARRPGVLQQGGTVECILEGGRLELGQTLLEQGCSEGASAWLVRTPLDAVKAFQSLSSELLVTLGLTKVRLGIETDFERLPTTLEELACYGLGRNMSHLVNLRILSLDANQNLTDIIWPPHLEELQLGPRFKLRLQGTSLPSGLKRLSIGGDGCHSGDLDFVEYLWRPCLVDRFNSSLDEVHLPKGLEFLGLGNGFNQDLTKAQLPGSVKVLRLGHRFNQSMDHVDLPDLIELAFGHSFGHSLKHAKLPGTLLKLVLGDEYKGTLEELPLQPGVLRTLACGRGPSQHFLAGKELLPSCTGITTLQLSNCADASLQGVKWPPGLQNLVLESLCDGDLRSIGLPDTLETVIIRKIANPPLPRLQFPDFLRRIQLGCGFNAPLQGTQWPRFLEILDLGVGIEQ